MTTWSVAFQPPLSVGSPRQEYWSGLPFPFPGMEPASSSASAGGFFPTKPPGKPIGTEAEDGFDPLTLRLRAQHTFTVPLCYLRADRGEKRGRVAWVAAVVIIPTEVERNPRGRKGQSWSHAGTNSNLPIGGEAKGGARLYVSTVNSLIHVSDVY